MGFIDKTCVQGTCSTVVTNYEEDNQGGVRELSA